MRVKALWDAAYEAGDTSRAFSFHRFQAIRNMLSDMGLLEWEDADLQFRQGVPVEGEREADGDDGGGVECSTTTPSPSSIVVCNMIAESLRERPEQVGLRPKMVFPSLLRTDWDSELAEAGLGASPGWLPEAKTTGTWRTAESARA